MSKIYKQGDIIEDESRKILILELVSRASKKVKNSKTIYKYKCLKCGNEDFVNGSKLGGKRKQG